MQVTVNGEQKVLDSDCTVADLLANLALVGRLAVEVNEEIIPRSQHPQHRLHPHDRIEIVRAIGGG